MIPGRLRRLLLLTVVAGPVVLAAAWLFYAPRRAPEGQPALLHLDAANFGTLRAEFNAAAGGTRLLVLLSPT